MVRLYGKAPYKVVLVHGGPGAIGSLKGFAQELNTLSRIGVVEAIQSKYSIEELIDELHSQISDNCNEKVSLIGHSWGAWLIALFAETYPESEAAFGECLYKLQKEIVRNNIITEKKLLHNNCKK